MECLQKFLEFTLKTIMDETDDSPVALRHFLHEVHPNDREIRALQKEGADNFLLQAKCAELVLDSVPLFFKHNSLKYPGFVQYGIHEDENGISGQSCDRLVESLASTFSWFEMSRADFAHCLLHFRNGVQFGPIKMPSPRLKWRIEWIPIRGLPSYILLLLAGYASRNGSRRTLRLGGQKMTPQPVSLNSLLAYPPLL
jgi:hypothetical protein